MGQQDLNKITKMLTYFYLGTQFTFIVITPFILCLLLGGWLKEKYSLGNWITIVSIILAFVIMFCDLFTFGRTVLKRIEKSQEKDKNVKRHIQK